MKKIISLFLQGLLYIAPIAVTLYVVFILFSFTDNLLQEWLTAIFGFSIPGLGLLIIVALLILIGFFGQTFFAKPFRIFFNRLIEKIPLLKVLYSAINDLFAAFIGKEKKFNKPVLVKVNLTSNLEKLGFLTEEDLSLINEKDKVAVYFPHSYNFSGELFIVPRDQVKALDIPAADVMKFIVSAGIADWD